MDKTTTLVERAIAAFRADAVAIPEMTSRGGAAVHSYEVPAAHDPEADEPSDAYLETDREPLRARITDVLAFDEPSACPELTMQVLGEYWIPNALYRDCSTTGA